MSQEWCKLTIHLIDQSQTEILLAWLNVLDADSIVEQENFVEAYIKKDRAEELKFQIESIDDLGFKSIELAEVESQNWNSVWESQFEPITLNDIYIYASFHDQPTESQRGILISPKMAFGTGHHETTAMMVLQMDSMNFEGKTVLDYGCGTGLLSVFAAMKGAVHIDAIDIQIEAVENTEEHFQSNGLADQSRRVKEGDLDVLEKGSYDVVLANINRHVLIDNATKLSERVKDNGQLIVSGVLDSDRGKIIRTYEKLGFEFVGEDQKGEWCMLVFKKLPI